MRTTTARTVATYSVNTTDAKSCTRRPTATIPSGRRWSAMSDPPLSYDQLVAIYRDWYKSGRFAEARVCADAIHGDERALYMVARVFAAEAEEGEEE